MSNTNERVIEITMGTSPEIKFSGSYITKRELDIVIKALKKAHRHKIREYRREAIIANYKLEQEQNNKKGMNDGQNARSSNASGANSGRNTTKIESGGLNITRAAKTNGAVAGSSTTAGKHNS